MLPLPSGVTRSKGQKTFASLANTKKGSQTVCRSLQYLK